MKASVRLITIIYRFASLAARELLHIIVITLNLMLTDAGVLNHKISEIHISSLIDLIYRVVLCVFF